MDFLQEAILKTLAYADIFAYPLNSEELYRFLIANSPPSFSSFKEVLKQMEAEGKPACIARQSFAGGQIEAEKGFYFLKKRNELVALRRKREKWSQAKIKIAQQVSQWFKLIPWVRMVGITGALAMANCQEKDDIDLLIITSPNRLWLSRLLVTFLTELLGKRRRPNDRRFKNKICLNAFWEENSLALPEEERDLFTAHEVGQVRLVWERNDTFKKFLWENRWAKEYLPNGLDTKILGYDDIKRKREKSPNIPISQYLNIILDFLEKLAYKSQLWYMRQKRTVEKIEPSRAFFHPGDCRERVLKEYNKRINKLC